MRICVSAQGDEGRPSRNRKWVPNIQQPQPPAFPWVSSVSVHAIEVDSRRCPAFGSGAVGTVWAVVTSFWGLVVDVVACCTDRFYCCCRCCVAFAGCCLFLLSSLALFLLFCCCGRWSLMHFIDHWCWLLYVQVGVVHNKEDRQHYYCYYCNCCNCCNCRNCSTCSYPLWRCSSYGTCRCESGGCSQQESFQGEK